MNQIHEDDWAEESWSRHSGMFDPSSWEDDSESNGKLSSELQRIIETARENGCSIDEIQSLTGLSETQIHSC